jgi:hypothetical protein
MAHLGATHDDEELVGFLQYLCDRMEVTVVERLEPTDEERTSGQS